MPPEMMSAMGESGLKIIPENVKFAAIILAIVPIVSIYPFLQKYFVKGVMIGSIKS
jgi:ABC-type glycerol-3-phosphate transport system permease component